MLASILCSENSACCECKAGRGGTRSGIRARMSPRWFLQGPKPIHSGGFPVASSLGRTRMGDQRSRVQGGRRSSHLPPSPWECTSPPPTVRSGWGLPSGPGAGFPFSLTLIDRKLGLILMVGREALPLSLTSFFSCFSLLPALVLRRFREVSNS